VPSRYAAFVSTAFARKPLGTRQMQDESIAADSRQEARRFGANRPRSVATA